MMVKFIIVTGGVYSGLGKGIVSASIGALLSPRYAVTNIKWDGYHNTNPGTMNPIEHGEVFVLDDGTEADLDFGHYERFMGNPTCGVQSITRGKLNDLISHLEKEGKRYEGRTIEEIPHLRDLLIELIEKTAAEQKADIIIFEIGGTVGDDSTNLALHAARMLHHKHGANNVMSIHLTPMSYTIDDHEPKSRPIQHSISELMGKGIDVDMLIVRTEKGHPLEDEQRRKLHEASILPKEAIIEARSLDTVYALPREFIRQRADELIAKKLNITVPGVSPEWVKLVDNIEHPKNTIKVAICGKYTNVKDSYKSVTEALAHACAHRAVQPEIIMVNTEQDDVDLSIFDAIIVPGGYGSRGIEGKINTVKYARENNIPFLGICYGLQLAVVEYARNICKLAQAHTTEVHPQTAHPVITILPEQQQVKIRSGTQRLGAQNARLIAGSLAANLYGDIEASERHRHRYEVNPEYISILTKHGLVISGVHSDHEHITEFIELPTHPFFIATQAHPELKSTLLRPAPLFMGLVDAAIMHKSA